VIATISAPRERIARGIFSSTSNASPDSDMPHGQRVAGRSRAVAGRANNSSAEITRMRQSPVSTSRGRVRRR
jgi:hypothetical protein